MTESHATESSRAEALARRFLNGGLSRREFLRRAGVFSTAALAASSLGAVVAACGGTTPSKAPGSAAPVASSGPKSGGTLGAALTGEPDTLDPAKSAIYTATQVVLQRLQHARRHRREERVLRRSRDEVGAAGPEDVGLRPC